MKPIHFDISPSQEIALQEITRAYGITEQDVLCVALELVNKKLDEGWLFKSESFSVDLHHSVEAEETLRRRILSVTSLASKAVSETVALNDSIRRGQ